MNVDDAIEAVARFFNDLIGAWVPGLVLTTGLVIMHLGSSYFDSLVRLSDGAGVALTIAGLLFALGHLLLAVNEVAVKPVLKFLKITSDFDEVKAGKRQSYTLFSELVDNRQSGGQRDWQFHDLRSVALSVSNEAASLGRRFMFISLLCSGVGTALLVLGADYLICLFWTPELLYGYKRAAPWGVQAFLLFSAAVFLFKQAEVFYARAMSVPFSVAFAELKFKRDSNVGNP
ncbi:hypothetical protein VNPA152081_57220 [Pseudomonas aeruginosa]|uniref:hypothetical protein n=1 Tax=Pseudomonas aeruginosa TaxID=287 RepID=UPI0021E1B64C|nr:hypothetical protein [Pseudomonas aeruginosa]EJB8381165.1 hypothetical protein [Pseudomonas aeruginosa]GLF61440.1 hypothetical protein VNPA141826_56040 [Pseudomonas aeruginosa]GLF80646.1 hypothetical protein VNPA152081_57220 [Pseudomonas aeruginosa]HBO3776790.1 hypothetical protein [Pseudomonas aeruginosa]